jgi:hypothetical protein
MVAGLKRMPVAAENQSLLRWGASVSSSVRTEISSAQVVEAGLLRGLSRVSIGAILVSTIIEFKDH